MKNLDWMEDILVEWGAWKGTIGQAEGWGGAGNAMEGSGWGKSAPGVHSDPVYREVDRSIKLGQRDCGLIDRLMIDFDSRDREIIWLRYVGEKVAVTTKTIVSIGTVEIAGGDDYGEDLDGNPIIARVKHPPIRLEFDMPLHWEYSGKLHFHRVAELAGISDDAAARIVRRVKKSLRTTIRLMQQVRRGLAGEALRAA